VTAAVAAPLCFVDTETDGVHPDRRPWEIALIRRDPDGTETTWAEFVQIDLSTSDPFGLRVGRFYDRHPLGHTIARGRPYAPAATRAAAAVRVAQLTHGAHLVGMVPNFDAEVLDRLLRDQGLAPAWHHHLIDVEPLVVGYLAAQGRPTAPPWKSTDLTEAIGVPAPSENERHTALGDARWARAAYDAVMSTPANPGRCPRCAASNSADLGGYRECRECGHGWAP
jgi:hypothetical protein